MELSKREKMAKRNLFSNEDFAKLSFDLLGRASQ